MSILRRLKRAVAASDFVWANMLDTAQVSSGERVNSDTALRLGAVWACVRLLADSVAQMPLDVFRRTGSTRVPVSPTPGFVARPSVRVTQREWVYQAMVSLLLTGNAYGVVTGRDALAYPKGVEWLTPTDVSLVQDNPLAEPRYFVGGKEVAASEIFHIRAYVVPGSARGLSPVEYHKETVGLGLAAQKFGAKWFRDGAHPSSILSTEQKVDEETAKTVKARFTQAVKGKREPAVLGAGVKYQQIQVAPDESQFLDTQNYTVVDVARIFGVPPEMIGAAGEGSSVTYANREQRAVDFLAFAVGPWLVRLEDALNATLPPPQFVKFNAGSLLRTDLKTRFEAYKVGRDGGWLSVNDIHRLEDEPPVEGGDDYLMPTTMRPIDEAASLKERIDSLGALVRAGFEPEAACAAVGVDPIDHTGLVPVTVQGDDGPAQRMLEGIRHGDELERARRNKRWKVLRDEEGFATGIEEVV